MKGSFWEQMTKIGRFPQATQHVVRVPLMPIRFPVRMPVARHDFEYFLRRVALGAGIDPVRQELPRALVSRPRHGEGDIRVNPQSQRLLLPVEAIAVALIAATVGCHEKMQASSAMTL